VALQGHRHVVLAGQRAAQLVEPDDVLLDEAGADPAAVNRLRLEGVLDRSGRAEALGDQVLPDPLVVRLRRR
jgi:hypothetical protein